LARTKNSEGVHVTRFAFLFIFLSLVLNNTLHAQVKIGSVFAVTGPIATFGQESMNGMRIALEQVNKTMPKGRKIEILFEDNKSEPLDSANAVRKLINVNKVHAVIGEVASSNTLSMAPIAQSAGIPLLTPASTNETVTDVGDFISRTCFTDAFQGVVMARFAKETLKKNTAAIIIDNASDYSKGLAKVFREEFTRLGGKIVDGDFSYIQKDSDFRTLLRRLSRAKPEAVFLPGYYTEAGLILKQAHGMNMNIPFLGGDGWDSPKLQELAGEGIKGNYISSHFSPDDQDPMVQEFVKEYTKRYNQRPGAMAALGYDGLMVMADAIKRAKSLSPRDIQDAINATKDFKGVSGTITIDERRNAKKSAVVLETTATGNVFKEKVHP
jgi:branched-chain amino acid transport system substrate-binding protein